MKISILTLFPELFEKFVNTSIISLSLTKKINEIEIINFRDYSKDSHKRVDDYQYGGGAGMVIGLQAIIDCLNDIKTKDSYNPCANLPKKKFSCCLIILLIEHGLLNHLMDIITKI